jgi:hypothetical protein
LPSGPTLAEFQEHFGAVGYEEKPLVRGDFGAFTRLYPDVHVGAQWGAGTMAPQWIEIDLGAAVPIGSIRLTGAHFPAGATVHEVYGGVGSPSATLLHTFGGDTREGDVLAHAFASPPVVRHLRVLTTASPSWVSWREIEVDGP